MRKIALAAAAAAALLVAAPATAQETEIIPTEPCEESAEYATLGLAGATEEVNSSVVPSVGHDFENLVRDETDVDPPPVEYHEQSAVSYRYRLDLSGSETTPDAATARLAFTLSWDNDGDYDLYVYDADGNSIGEGQNGFNPIDGAGESLLLGSAAHCLDIRVDIVNYLAPGGPATAMELSTRVSNLRP